MGEQILPDLLESAGFPITVAFPKTGGAFYSERITGNLWFYKDEKYTLVHHFPIIPITGHHETGLLGIALDPEFEKNGNIFCFYSYGADESDISNKIVKINIENQEEVVVLDGIPGGRIHNGGIIAFNSDGMLYAGVGVANEIKERAQDIEHLGGKVLRINPDGSIPVDNPFPDSPVYSYGHRNIFGLAFHPQTGKLYISEEGPDRDDEINIIQPGGNYGWPNVTGSSDTYDFINPIVTYTPTITPTQCVFAENDFYFGSFNEGTVHRLKLAGPGFDRVEKDNVVYRGKPFGVVGVFYGPDKQLYVGTPNKIMRFSPEE